VQTLSDWYFFQSQLTLSSSTMASIESKVFVITGGASGMGLATGKLLAEKKAKAVCIGDFNEKAFDAARAEINKINPDTVVHTTKVDVSSSKEVNAWIKEVVAKFGQLDGAVNAAGVAQAMGVRKGSPLVAETDEMWTRTIGVNLNGVFHSCRAQVEAMLALPQSPRSIVNIASIAALVHAGDCYGYGASKAAVVYLSQCLAKEVLPSKIRVNIISPGATRTPMLSQFFGSDASSGEIDTSGWDVVEPLDIAKAVVWLLSDDSHQVAGVNIPVGPGAP